MKTKENNKKIHKPRDSNDGNQISISNNQSTSPLLETSKNVISISQNDVGRKSSDEVTKVWRERGNKPTLTPLENIEKQLNDENATELSTEGNQKENSDSDRRSNSKNSKSRKSDRGNKSNRSEKSSQMDRSDRGVRSNRGDRSDRGERSQRVKTSNEKRVKSENGNNDGDETKQKKGNRRVPIKTILDELIDITDSDSSVPAAVKSVSDDEIIGDGFRGLFTKNDSK
jgi:hypothetical protein